LRLDGHLLLLLLLLQSEHEWPFQPLHLLLLQLRPGCCWHPGQAYPAQLAHQLLSCTCQLLLLLLLLLLTVLLLPRLL
jgi:hypothetical protein